MSAAAHHQRVRAPSHPQGLLSMANMGPNTNQNHFSILCNSAPHLNTHYTVFGEVVSGYKVGAFSRGPLRGTCLSFACAGSLPRAPPEAQADFNSQKALHTLPSQRSTRRKRCALCLEFLSFQSRQHAWPALKAAHGLACVPRPAPATLQPHTTPPLPLLLQFAAQINAMTSEAKPELLSQTAAKIMDVGQVRRGVPVPADVIAAGQRGKPQ